METLSSLFQKSNGTPIEWDGRLIYQMFRRELLCGKTSVQITRVSQKASVIQGLRIKVQNGMLEVNGQQLDDIVLWADSSPGEVLIDVSETATAVSAWNVWKHSNLMQAWTGNAGIQIDEQDGAAQLFCSDGIGERNFTDLIVRIDFKAALTPKLITS
jgi:hypothetical protein